MMIVRKFKILFKNLLSSKTNFLAPAVVVLVSTALLTINNAFAGGGEEDSDSEYTRSSSDQSARNIRSDGPDGSGGSDLNSSYKDSGETRLNYRDKRSYSSDGSDIPLTTDSRIKTYIYSPNEVFLLVLHYGFQSHIEFSKGEVIDTITLGDTYAWKIVPIDNRLFIRPMEKNIRTNMTIITNKNTYQFDLVAKELEDGEEKDLVYLVRFYYPDKRRKG